MSQSADRPLSTVANWIEELVRDGLLGDDQARDLLKRVPPGARASPSELLDQLVARGDLTRFQADKLLRGHGHSLVLGPYVLLGPLGRGGMGVVYLARHRSGGPPLALKVLPPSRARERPRTLTRFLREKEIGLRLPAHPNLTRTLDAGDSGGTHYLAMEFVPGRTVKQLVADGGPLAVGRAARVFADVAVGLHAAHEAGFIHRDLKPANILVTPAGRAKLLDFGFALLRGEPTPTDPAVLGGPGYTLGTMDYLPPEQAVDPLGVGVAADLYALGCSLYFALTGVPPFPGGSVKEKLRWHRVTMAPPLEQFNPSVPPELIELVNRLMAKRAEDRPASAGEVALRLEQWSDPAAPDSPVLDEVLVEETVEPIWDDDAPTPDSDVLAPPPGQTAGSWLPWPVLTAALGVFAGILVMAAALGWLIARLLS